MVSLSVELQRATLAHLQGLRSAIDDFDDAEIARVNARGIRLFENPAGPRALFGNLPEDHAKSTKPSGNADPADAPAALVERLESSPFGCTFLYDAWQELRSQLDPGKFWQSIDRFKCIKLMGQKPLDANEDRRV